MRSSLCRRAMALSISRAAMATSAVLCGRKMSIRPDRSTTPTTWLSNGSRIGTPAQLHGLMPAQKCSAAWTNTGSPVHSAVPMPLVPTTCSFQTPPTSRWMRRPTSSVRRSPAVSTITPSSSVRISIASAPSRRRPPRANKIPGRLAQLTAARDAAARSGWRSGRMGASSRVASMALMAQRCHDSLISGRTSPRRPYLLSPSVTKVSQARMIARSS